MKEKTKYGLQMFGCSADFKKNPDYFFKTMGEYGYSIIEPCIIFDDAEEFKRKHSKAGIKPPQLFPICSGHTKLHRSMSKK